ncbi:DUF72 domain-containing protein [bacterium]|nr:MAG: DUF72 domain-containing protein [bacterium]
MERAPLFRGLMEGGVRIGCRGFPVGRERYFRELTAVEVSDTRKRLPKLETARRWREEAPEGFQFSLVVPSAITHPPEGSPRAAEACGHFRDAPLVRRAWEAFEAVAEAVKPRWVVFETPASFYPHARMLQDMYAFFRSVRRGGATFVWASHGGPWEPKFQAKVAADLKLVLATDPLNGAQPAGAQRYLRVAGRVAEKRLNRGVSFTDDELKALLYAAQGGTSAVFLGNTDCWKDAKRLNMISMGHR